MAKPRKIERDEQGWYVVDENGNRISAYRETSSAARDDYDKIAELYRETRKKS
jgi:hypothetical protein